MSPVDNAIERRLIASTSEFRSSSAYQGLRYYVRCQAFLLYIHVRTALLMPDRFLGRVDLGAQRSIVVKLSRERAVARSVGLSVQCIMGNGGSDQDAVPHHRSDGFRDEAGSEVWDRSREGAFLGATLGHTIVTNGDFTAYVCYSAATRPSSQITLGQLVNSAG